MIITHVLQKKELIISLHSFEEYNKISKETEYSCMSQQNYHNWQ